MKIKLSSRVPDKVMDSVSMDSDSAVASSEVLSGANGFNDKRKFLTFPPQTPSRILATASPGITTKGSLFDSSLADGDNCSKFSFGKVDEEENEQQTDVSTPQRQIKDDSLLFLEDLPEFVTNLQNPDEKINRHEFILYGGPFSPLPMTKITNKLVKKNDIFAIIVPETDDIDPQKYNYYWQRGVVVQVNKDSWKIEILECDELHQKTYDNGNECI